MRERILKSNVERSDDQVIAAFWKNTPYGGRKSGQFIDADLEEARAEGEKNLAFELWAYIAQLEAATENVQDQIQRESRQNILHELKRIAGGKPANGSTHGARWPRHDTQQLTALRLAAVKFWSNFDPRDPETAPTNAAVVEWLQSEQNISRSSAEAMATILRADGLKSGPRPRS